jgi:hypothetical protein
MTPQLRRISRSRPRSRPRGAPRAVRRAADATSEPDPGPAPEAVFDRVTGPYLRRNAAALPGARACDEDA